MYKQLYLTTAFFDARPYVFPHRWTSIQLWIESFFFSALEYGLFKFADVLKSKCKDNRKTDVKRTGERHEEKGLLIDNFVQH